MLEKSNVTVIEPKNRILDFHLKELIHYKDLIILFVHRTFVSQYKQTILGPAWAVIQPLLTTVIFTIIFGNIAQLSTDGVPQFMFYMCGNVAWNYFNGCLTTTGTTFTSNSAILGKVYFPRLVMPISTVLTQFISFGIQLVMFLIFWIIALVQPNCAFKPTIYLMLVPILIIEMACLALGCGVIISALTTKYKDLAMLITFGTQLWMYLTPIAYTTSIIPEKYYGLYMLNPMAPIIEGFRFAFFGKGTFNIGYWGISVVTTLMLLIIGILLFNRVEKTFMDTI